MSAVLWARWIDSKRLLHTLCFTMGGISISMLCRREPSSDQRALRGPNYIIQLIIHKAVVMDRYVVWVKASVQRKEQPQGKVEYKPPFEKIFWETLWKQVRSNIKWNRMLMTFASKDTLAKLCSALQWPKLFIHLTVSGISYLEV